MSEVGLNDPDVSFQGQQSLMLNEKNYRKFLTNFSSPNWAVKTMTQNPKQWKIKKKNCVWFRNADGPFFVSYRNIDCFAEN